MQDSRNKKNGDDNRQQNDLSKRDNQQNTSTRDLSADKSLQKDTEENDRLKTHESDNYERDAE